MGHTGRLSRSSTRYCRPAPSGHPCTRLLETSREPALWSWPAGASEAPAVNRYYDPSSYQFLSIDPKVGTTLQPYAFVGGDPLNATDPLGLSGGFPNARSWSTVCHSRHSRCRGGLRLSRIAHAIRHLARNIGRFERAHWKAEVAIGGIAAGVVAGVATGGAAFAVEAGVADTLATTADVATTVAVASDSVGCATGRGDAKVASCAGALTGGLGAGAVSVLGDASPAASSIAQFVGTQGRVMWGVGASGSIAISDYIQWVNPHHGE